MGDIYNVYRLGKRLTDGQKRFADEYFIDLNATRSYKVAYPKVTKDRTAASLASRMLGNEKVAAYVQAKQKKAAGKLEITAERVLKEYARLGFYNVKDIMEEDGSLKKIKDLSDDSAAAIQGIDIQSTTIGADHELTKTKKVKLAAKHQALEALAKHLGLFNKDNQENEEPAPIKVTIVREDGRKQD